MGLVFYYLFHYLSFFLPPPFSSPLFLPGLKVNINQQQHLCCVLLFILQSYAAAAVLSEEVHLQYSADTCGLFMVVLVVAWCDMQAVHSCGPKYDITQWMFHFKASCCWDNSWPCSCSVLLLFLPQQSLRGCIFCGGPDMLLCVHFNVKPTPFGKLMPVHTEHIDCSAF